MNSKIEVLDFSKKYVNHQVVLDDFIITKRVNLIVGKNGSGKSTLLKAMAGLINHDGAISYIGKGCYMDEVFSYPLDVDLYSFLELLNATSEIPSETKRIDKLISYFELDNKVDETLNTLSKGMKAKVNLIQCLLEDADFYLLDEPLSGLDKKGIQCLKRYISNSESQFIISTHLDKDLIDISNAVIYL